MTKFEDRLFDDLFAEHGPALATAERPEKRHHNYRPLWITGGAVALASAAAISFTVVGGGAPAYGVTQNPNGTITLTFTDAHHLAETNQRLEELAVPVRVDEMSSSCAAKYDGQSANNRRGTLAFMSDGRVTVDVKNIPHGHTVVVGIEPIPPTVIPTGPATGVRHNLVGVAAFLIDGDVPSCVYLPATDPMWMFTPPDISSGH